MKPWEKYSQPEQSGPWSRYSAQTEKGVGEQINEAIADVPRQAGMFGRFVMEGVGNTADLLTAPMRAVYDPIARATGLPTAATNLGGMAADVVGLPEPQNKLERVAGHVARTVAGTGGVIGAAKTVAAEAPSVTAQVVKSLAARPDAQLASATGAGTAGGYVEETGGGPVAQFLASLAGGLAGPAVLNKAQQAVSGVRQLADKLMGSPNLNLQIDAAIESAIRPSGLKLSDLSANVRNQLHDDILNAMKHGQLSPEATRRLADYRLIGATPTRANLTLDPAEVTQQRNLAKMGANSQDPKLQQLAQVQNQNNKLLTTRVNELGGDADPFAASEKIIGSLAKTNEAAKSTINAKYAAARGAEGRSALLDPAKFTQAASDKLDDALLGSKLPDDVRNKLNQIASGKMPLTVDVAEQLKTRIGDLQRGASEPSVRKSLGLVREALEETPLLEGQGQAAIDAFNQARSANRSWMQIVEKTPALQAVREAAEPDKFVQSFLIGSGPNASTQSVFNLRQQIKSDPEAMTAVKGAVTNFLKTKALSGAADEVGNFSQSNYNKALTSIGERKLAMFFSPTEVAQLKAIGRVASYEQFQPVGSAVNNSNTATTLVSTLLDKVGNSALLRKVPLGAELLSNPVKSISGNVKASQAMNVPKSIVMKDPSLRKLPPVLIPLLIEQQ